MSPLRITNFCWISCIFHLLAAICVISFAHDASLCKPKAEAVCFVNLDDLKLPASVPQSVNHNQKDNSTLPTHQNAKTNLQTKLASPSEVIQKMMTPAIPEKMVTPPQPPSIAAPLQAVSQSAPQSSSLSSSTAMKAAAPVSNYSNQQFAPKTSSSSSAVGSGRMLSDVSFGSSSGPSFIHRELPVYPHLAKRFNKEGKVVLRLTIDEGGALKHVEVIDDPGYGLASAAVDAVKKSRFVAARIDGKPVMSKAILPVRFAMNGID